MAVPHGLLAEAGVTYVGLPLRGLSVGKLPATDWLASSWNQRKLQETDQLLEQFHLLNGCKN